MKRESQHLQRLFVLLPILLSSCAFQETALHRIERISGLDLPEGMSEVFSFEDETFTGVAGQYTVFSLTEEVEFFVNPKDGPDDLSEDEKANILYNLEHYYTEVPSSYFPDFSHEFLCARGMENTFVFYFPGDLQIKVFMMGH